MAEMKSRKRRRGDAWSLMSDCVSNRDIDLRWIESNRVDLKRHRVVENGVERRGTGKDAGKNMVDES